MYSKLVMLASFGSLVHAAFSAAQYRSYLRVSEQNFTGLLPYDIVLQALCSLLILLYTIVSISGNFKVILANHDFDHQPHDQIFTSPQSFITFNHRGRVLASKLKST